MYVHAQGSIHNMYVHVGNMNNMLSQRLTCDEQNEIERRHERHHGDAWHALYADERARVGSLVQLQQIQSFVSAHQHVLTSHTYVSYSHIGLTVYSNHI